MNEIGGGATGVVLGRHLVGVEREVGETVNDHSGMQPFLRYVTLASHTLWEVFGKPQTHFNT